MRSTAAPRASKSRPSQGQPSEGRRTTARDIPRPSGQRATDGFSQPNGPSQANRRVRSGWPGFLAIALLALGLVVARVLADSASAVSAGDTASEQGNPELAIEHYQHAVRMYVPGSPYVRRALERLEKIAAGASQRGEATGERLALEAIRAGLLGARSLYTPHAERLAAVDRRLAALYARIEDPSNGKPEARQAWFAERLARRPGPRPLISLLAIGGLGLWLGASVLFIRRGLDRGLRLRPRWALFAGVAFLVGFALFVFGLRFA